MRVFQKYFWTLIDYGPAIITIIFGSYVALAANRKSVPSEDILNWILVMLVLISATQLIDRLRSLRSIESAVEEISLLIRKERKGSPFLRKSERPRFSEVAIKATTIDSIGWSMEALFSDYEDMLENKINNGCKIRFIIVDPSSDAVNVIYENSRSKEIKDDISRTIARYKRVCQRVGQNAMNFELKAVNWIAPYSMIIIDGHKPGGFMWMGLNPVYLPTSQSERRTIVIDSQYSLEEFEHFRGQFEELWKDEKTIPVK